LFGQAERPPPASIGEPDFPFRLRNGDDWRRLRPDCAVCGGGIRRPRRQQRLDNLAAFNRHGVSVFVARLVLSSRPLLSLPMSSMVSAKTCLPGRTPSFVPAATQELVFRMSGVGRTDVFAACFRDGRSWRNRRLQPKTAFSHLPPVHGADLKGQLRVQAV
jgi:hypothetical protein